MPLPALLPLLLAGSPAAARPVQWWADVAAIADDRNEGRQTGSPGHLRAAAYVERRFRQLGLAPAGERGGYRQRVALRSQTVDLLRSRAALVDGLGRETSLAIPDELIVYTLGGPRPPHLAAPLVFAGYGLHLPERGYDDLAGLDLAGKVAVIVAGAPAGLSGPARAAARNDIARQLGRRGAVGLVSLASASQIEVPWARQKLLASQPGMYLADPALRSMPDGFLLAAVAPEAAERLFEGSGHRFAEVAALADAGRPQPRFALGRRLRADLVVRSAAVSSPNLVARLDGAGPAPGREYVVLSAHLDHLGTGAPVAGDGIYNGAMDDASGVASVLDIAARLRAGPRPQRSMLFLIVTAEEKGLLGSWYFARRPTVPPGAIIADLNFDMPLPLWPLTSVLVPGEAESTLGAVARGAAAAQGLRLVPDPLPERNSFTRTDQFSFVRAGVPALAFRFGFEPGTEAFRLERDWRATRYHAPSDDLAQPGVLREEAVRLDDYVVAVARAVADDPARPRWLDTSPFRSRAEAE